MDNGYIKCLQNVSNVFVVVHFNKTSWTTEYRNWGKKETQTCSHCPWLGNRLNGLSLRPNRTFPTLIGHFDPIGHHSTNSTDTDYRQGCVTVK